MKHKHFIVILCCVTLALVSLHGVAQTSSPDMVDGQDMIQDSLTGDNYKVQVAFRTVERENLLGGVSVVNIPDMMTKSYSLSSLSYLDATIGGVNGYRSWGMDNLMVVVDGIPRDDNNVLPSEIEQVTVLKGAAAVALYGSRAYKGVIQITTKRGKAEALKVSVRANTGIHTPKDLPKYLGSAEYMTLYNEARVNDGLTPSYTQEAIDNHASGVNPYRYPDLDFYSSEFLRKMYNRSEAMAEVTGGNERARFYSTTGYYREGSLLKVGNTKDDNISRMFVRGNIDLSLHELITANVDANATFYDAKTSNIANTTANIGTTYDNYWHGASRLRPNRVAPLIPLSYIGETNKTALDLLAASSYIIDGKFLGSTQLDQVNPIADAYAAGDGKLVNRQFQFNGGVNFNLKNVADGLFFRAKYGVDYALTYLQRYTQTYATFTPTWSATADTIVSLTKYRDDQKTGNQTIDATGYRTTTFFSGQFDYTKKLSGGHNIYALLLANGWQRKQSAVYQSIVSTNLGLQLSYDYRQKYYVDFTGAAVHSGKLPEGNRRAFSPTGTLGWRLTKEDFMSSQSIFDDLMLTASAGVINSDLDITTEDNQMGYFLYKQVLQTGGWWSWGDAGGESAAEFQRGTNNDLTFIKRKEFSIGLRGSLLDKAITFDANYFNSTVDGDIVRAVSIYPIYFTQTGYPTSSIIPYTNYNIDDRQGVDFSVYFNKKAGDVSVTLGLSGMYLADKAVRRDESYEYDYQTRMGRPINQVWGLESLGFFTDADDIANSPSQFGELKPGDIKYKDRNGDGVIDSNDEVFLGNASSPTVLGVNLTVKWKSLTLFAMGTGYFGGYGMKNSSYYWVFGDGKYSEVVRDRWTEETKNTATYPRLTTESGDNNFRNSDFWLYKTNRFNLSMVQITYDVPSNVFKSGAVKDLSVYLGGYNLLTLSKERQHMEMNVGSAPQTRFYNLGVKATF